MPKLVPEITKADLAQAKELFQGDYIDPDFEGEDMRLPLHVEEKVCLLRTFIEQRWNEAPQPVMIYFRGNFKGHINKKAGKFNRFCDLEIIGTNKSIVEATLIQTAVVMLNEAGYKNLCVEINSIGDKDSLSQFTKDLTLYYRKNINEIDAECRQTLKKDVFELLTCKKEACKVVNAQAPKSMSYLSDKSRLHFREVLEYLESLGIPYRINEHLLGNKKYCSETIYEIINRDDTSCKSKTLAIGVRYDALSKKVGSKKEIPGAGISLLLKPDPTNELQKPVNKFKRPVVYFIQLGFEAKLLSLKIMELLRQAKVPVYQALSKDKLVSQMVTAEKMKIPFTILIGKKEALENSAIVRRMDTHAQETVKIDDLVSYLKKILKKI